MSKSTESNSSLKRLLVAITFGSFFHSYLLYAFCTTIPYFLSKNWVNIYTSNLIFSLIESFLIAFFTGIVSSFISRVRGIWVGVLANFIPTIFFLLLIKVVFPIFSEDLIRSMFNILFYELPPSTKYNSIYLIGLFIGSISGGIIGQNIYHRLKKLDLNEDKFAIFNIRWFHYIWLFPLIIYPYFCSFIYIFLLILIFDTGYFNWSAHNELMFNWKWLLSIFGIIPILLIISIFITFFGIKYLYSSIKLGQNRDWKRLALIIFLAGFGVPMLVPTIAFYGGHLHHILLKSTVLSNPKIGLFFIISYIGGHLGIIGIIFSLLIATYNYLKIPEKDSVSL